MQDELKKNLILLKSLQKNLRSPNLYDEQVQEYNGILRKIENHDCSLKEFMIRPNELKPRLQGWYSDGNKQWSKPRIAAPDFLKKLDAALEYLDSQFPSSPPSDDVGFTKAFNICNRFGEVARQLRCHRKDHSPLLLNDEYDVQYLLHALLKIHFDDVRPEERAPSYAGSSTTLDFLLPDEKIVIEVKFARDAGDTKRFGSEILIDIPHYVKHPDCEQMFVLIYDPNRALRNPVGLVKDLGQQSFKGNPIQVFVAS